MSEEFNRVIPYSPQPHRGIYKRDGVVIENKPNKALIQTRKKELETLYKLDIFLQELKVEGLKIQMRENFIELNHTFNITSKEYNNYLKDLENSKK